MAATLVDIATEKAPTQRVMIDLLTEESPFLQRMPMEACSDGNINKFEKLTSVGSAQIVNIDEALPVVTSETSLESTTLSRLGGLLRAGKNLIDMWPGGKDAYYAKKLMPVLRESGNQLEQTLLYNTFMQAAVDAGNVIDCGGATADVQNSMLVIKWGEGETNGLYNPNLTNTGKMFSIHDINGGNVYENPTSAANELVYGRYMETFIGAQVAKSRNVFVLKNIDLTDDGSGGYLALPEERDVNDALDAVRANSTNTEIWSASAVANAMGVEYSGAAVNTMPVNEERRNIIRAWNDIPMLASYNFKQNAEAVYS